VYSTALIYCATIGAVLRDLFIYTARVLLRVDEEEDFLLGYI